MPTIVTHAVTAATLTSAFPVQVVPRRLIVLGAICAMAPDVDVLGFALGIHYADPWGHRGLTHSLAFAIACSVVAWLAAVRVVPGLRRRILLWVYLFLCTASHGLLDAMTDGGLGIAFFSPFDTTRYFFPFRPIEVSPIGAGFFSERGISVLRNEFLWVWLPFLAFAVVAFVVRHLPGLQRKV
jgi:inner membrane protein